MAKSKNIPAPFWKRVVAYILDVIIISFIVTQPFMAKFQPIQPKNITEFLRSIQGTLTKEVLILSLVVASLTLLYWSFLEFNFQQSVGKILMRIKVKGTGKKAPTIFQIIIRNVTKLSTVLIIFDTFYMILKKSNQRYFERISKTTVVREDSLV